MFKLPVPSASNDFSLRATFNNKLPVYPIIDEKSMVGLAELKKPTTTNVVLAGVFFQLPLVCRTPFFAALHLRNDDMASTDVCLSLNTTMPSGSPMRQQGVDL